MPYQPPVVFVHAESPRARPADRTSLGASARADDVVADGMANRMSGRPVLISRAHRSGTTWVGATLSADEGIAYLHKPFNVAHLHPGICAARFPRSFMHINTGNSSEYREDLAKMLRWEFSWHDAAVAAARSAMESLSERLAHSGEPGVGTGGRT